MKNFVAYRKLKMGEAYIVIDNKDLVYPKMQNF